MKSIQDIMGSQRVLPIVQSNSIENSVKAAEVMFNQGINVIEVVLREENSIKSISAIKETLPNIIVGAGTITNGEMLAKAIEAGADFIVTPAISETLISSLIESPIPVLPGVSNTGEILLAVENGFKELKLFPAEAVGGKKLLSSIKSVFNNIKFCPTGGISSANMKDYMELENVFAVGGTWMVNPSWINNQEWEKIATNSAALTA